MDSKPPRRFPVGWVLAGVLLSASVLLVWWGRKTPPEIEHHKPLFKRADGHNSQAVGQPVNRQPNAWKSSPHQFRIGPTNGLRPLDPAYTPPEGTAWHRAELEKSPVLWMTAYGGKLPLDAREEMLTYFRHTTNLVTRETLGRAMMVTMPGDDLALAVCYAVTNDYRHLTVSDTDADHILDLFAVLGFGGRSASAVAFEIALQGTEFEFWEEQHRPFVKALDDDGKEHRWAITVFASEAIKALGWADDPRVPAILMKLRNRDINYTYYTSSALVDAAYSQYSIAERKLPGFRPAISDGFARFQQWATQTQNGREWNAWADAIGKQRPTVRRD